MEKNETFKLSSVKLIEDGLKGIEVSYGSVEFRGKREYFNEYKVKRRAPASSELMDKFKELKEYMLDICGYVGNESELKNMENNLMITGVTYTDEGFVLIGKMKVLAGDKVVSLSTPLIVNSEEYFDFKSVIEVLNSLYLETTMYMDGKKEISNLQLAMKFAEKNQQIDKEAIGRMSDKELTEFVTPMLEKMGHCVILNDEMEESVDNGSEKGEMATVFEKEEVTPESPIIVEAKSSITAETFGETDDDFTLDLKFPEAKESTATKI